MSHIERETPSIGIVGAGQIGSAIASMLARQGIRATLSNSRGPESLAQTVAALGPSIEAGTREQAASKEVVFVAVNWSKLPQALSKLASNAGTIFVDTNNSIEAPLFKPAELGGRTSTEVFASMLPAGARVVKAFNHLQAALLASDPAKEGGKRVLFYSGDDDAAKAEVGALIERLGFFGIDLGSLAVGAKLVQFPGGPLPTLNLVKLG